MSEDELAEVLAVSRKMLRKKSRREILDLAYEQSAYRNEIGLPKWFTQDENRHTMKIPMVTKEEADV